MDTTFFDNIEQLREALPVGVSFSLSDLKAYLRQARDRYLLDLLGREFLDEQAATPDADLLPYIRQVLAGYSIALYIPFGAVLFSGGGIKKTATEKEKPLTLAEQQSLIDRAMADGDAAAETLLSFLESRRDRYATWWASSACSAAVAEYVPTADVLNQFVFIDRSRRRFRELLPALCRADLRVVRPLLGAAMDAELKAQLKAATLTEANKVLVSYIRPLVAYLAVGQEMKCDADAAFDELKALLYADPDLYPTWRDSPAYRPTLPDTFQNPDGAGVIYL